MISIGKEKRKIATRSRDGEEDGVRKAETKEIEKADVPMTQNKVRNKYIKKVEKEN